jgi:protein-S-isoprenylcysteine O-methyltransferase Ste14
MNASFLERGGLWVLAQSALMIGVTVLGLIWPGDANWPAAFLAGAALLVIGAYFGIAGVMALKTNRTPFPKPREDSQLVQHGIYSLARHPLYTSVILISLGWALLCRSWPALVAAVIMIPFFNAKAKREEQWLREKFPAYAEYERRVGRFLPWL